MYIFCMAHTVIDNHTKTLRAKTDKLKKHVWLKVVGNPLLNCIIIAGKKKTTVHICVGHLLM